MAIFDDLEAEQERLASILVALDFILDLKQLGIVGMNGHSLFNPSQGRE